MQLLRPILATAAAVLLVPQTAQAATIDPLNTCYRSVDQTTRETVRVYGHDFTPGQRVDVFVDETFVNTALPDSNGDVIGSVTAPYRRSGEAPFTIRITEQGQASNTATVWSWVTALGVRLRPSLARPSRRVRFTGRGFTEGTSVFAHYVRAGKVRKTVRLGTPTGPCGRIDVKRRQIPIKRPAVGRWTLQVDNQPIYSAMPPSVYVRLPITVKRVPRPSS